MKKTLTFLTLFIACFLSLTSLGQEVTFSNQSTLIQNTTGTVYEDCVVDVNIDGLDDVVRVTGGGLYIDYQQPDGSFTPFYFANNWANPPGWSLASADLNGDGYRDFLFGNGQRVSFVFSSDDGTTWTEDQHPEYIFSQRSSIHDIDVDGDLDAFVCHDVDQSHVYWNDGNGNMTLDISAFETYNGRGNYANMWVDYDNDGDTDFYLTKCSQPNNPGHVNVINKMYRNNGDGTFTEVGEETNTNDDDQSWTTVFEDFDNDGDFDLFTVNHDIKNMLQSNNGDGTFSENLVEVSGVDGNDLGAWELDAHDFNNDGFVDIITEHNPPLYYGNGDMTFTPGDLGFASGAFGDLNNDGFLDCMRGNTLFMNNGNTNNYVKVNLLGIISNSDGIGARVEVHSGVGTADEMIQIREVRSGRSFSPMSNLSANFGIGTATSIDQIIVKWPSGVETVVENPDVNTTHLLPEADCLNAPSEITASASTSICPGSSVTLSGPMGSDSYLWSNGEETQSIEANTGGVYSLALFDGDNCASLSNDISVVVIQDETPEITANGDLEFCEGGSVILSSSEAAGYTWSNEGNTQTIEVSEPGVYTVSTIGMCSDQTSEGLSVTVLSNPAPVAQDVSAGPGSEVTLTASGVGTLTWYSDEDLSTEIGTGPSLLVPSFNLDEDTDFWVTNTVNYGGGLASGAKESLGADGTFGTPSTGGYSYFDVYEEFTLIDATVTAAGGGDRTFTLTDEFGATITSQTFSLVDGENLVVFNWVVPVGNGLSIRSDQINLLRNNQGVDYPYAVSDVASIYGSNNGPIYYYYFYNWSIEKASVTCVTQPVQVTASVVGIEELTSINGVEIFPNPVANDLVVTFNTASNESLTIDVINSLGQTVITETKVSIGTVGQRLEMNVSNLEAGVYSIRFIGSEGEYTGSFVKK